MSALLRVGVLVKCGAREIAETMGIVGKMSGHPVQHHAETFAATGIDQPGKIRGTAEPAGRRLHAGRLVAPGAVKRMLADRQKFYVGKAEITGITRKPFGEIAIGQPLVVALAPPRTE